MAPTLAPSLAPSLSADARDLRLDFFRGLALIFIFLDHIPGNFVSWVTSRNIGFSDAAEIFIFISGYTATLAYGRVMCRNGFLFGAARIMRRCWQLYVAHIFLFVLFTAQISYVAQSFQNPMYPEEMGVVEFLSQPHLILPQVLLLKFNPRNMDILPLYIVLMVLFPLLLWLLLRWPRLVLLGSGLLYFVSRWYQWNLSSYPDGSWVFDPFCWQFLFVIGAFFGRRHGAGQRLIPWRPLVLVGAVLYLIFAFLVVLTWHVAALGVWLPNGLGELLYPIDKTTLDPLRLTHFLALAYLTVQVVGPDARFLRWRLARPIITCGRQSLQVFCVGTFLAFAGHFVLVEIDSAPPTQALVSGLGIALMIGVAYMLTWYQRIDSGLTARGKAAPAAPTVSGRSGAQS